MLFSPPHQSTNALIAFVPLTHPASHSSSPLSQLSLGFIQSPQPSRGTGRFGIPPRPRIQCVPVFVSRDRLSALCVVADECFFLRVSKCMTFLHWTSVGVSVVTNIVLCFICSPSKLVRKLRFGAAFGFDQLWRCFNLCRARFRSSQTPIWL